MTALQELITFSDKLYLNENIKNKYATLIGVAMNLLEKEKQQIIDAYEEANNKICESCWDCKIGEEYYKNTYGK